MGRDRMKDGMPEKSHYFPLKVEFEYAYSLGDLRPYFDALQHGRALAARCPKCGTVSFPPRLVCAQDYEQSAWHQLPGSGTIVQVTAGKYQTLALIAMDGADNLCVGKMGTADVSQGTRVKLAVSPEREISHPAQFAYYQPIGNSQSPDQI